MAKRTVVTLTDDLDGGPAEETITFGLDGEVYEIDLSEPHAEQLRRIYDPYADAGRAFKSAKAKRKRRAT